MNVVSDTKKSLGAFYLGSFKCTKPVLCFMTINKINVFPNDALALTCDDIIEIIHVLFRGHGVIFHRLVDEPHTHTEYAG